MIDALSSPAAGLRTSANQFEKAAQRVVKATEATPSSDGDDLPAAVVDTKISALGFEANAAVFKTADKMIGTLLDTLA